MERLAYLVPIGDQVPQEGRVAGARGRPQPLDAPPHRLRHALGLPKRLLGSPRYLGGEAGGLEVDTSGRGREGKRHLFLVFPPELDGTRLPVWTSTYQPRSSGSGGMRTPSSRMTTMAPWESGAAMRGSTSAIRCNKRSALTFSAHSNIGDVPTCVATGLEGLPKRPGNVHVDEELHDRDSLMRGTQRSCVAQAAYSRAWPAVPDRHVQGADDQFGRGPLPHGLPGSPPLMQAKRGPWKRRALRARPQRRTKAPRHRPAPSPVLRNVLEHGNGGNGVPLFTVSEDPGLESAR